MAPPSDVAAGINRLEELTTSLRLAYRDLGTLQAAEVQNRADAWRASQDTTVNGRQNFSVHMTAETSAEVLQLKGDIAALEAERTFLVFVLDLMVKGFV